MKYCYNCGQPMDDDSRFCTYCGTKAASEPEPVPASEPVPEPEEVSASVATPVIDAVDEPVAEVIPEVVPEPVVEPVYEKVPEPEIIPAPVPVYTEPTPAPTPTYTQPEVAPGPAPTYSQQTVYSAPQATYTQPVAPQRSPGKTIAGFVLGIVSLSCGGLGVIFALVALNRYAAIAAMVYAIIFGLFAVGCGIAGMILSAKAASVEPDNKKARLGKTFSLIGLIAGGCAIVFGIIFGIIGISKLANYWY